jgi:alkanesulfonate monooxygenase SsuD/methylene tetrahydromethanopterin reductase-like flavin-dependent oxidoreductase (luciferase family)
MTIPFEQLLGDRFIVGGPAECAAEIRKCVQATGATEMIFRLYWPGMDHGSILRTIRMMGEKVWPLVAA